MTTIRALYFSATISTLDGSDTNAYGEACEPGQGYREQSGHWSPDRSYWSVYPDRSQVQPDVYPERGSRTPGQWLADRLAARLGSIEPVDARTFSGARQAIHPGRLTGRRSQGPGLLLGSGTLFGDAIAASRLRWAPVGLRTLTAAGHAHGFTDGEIADAAELLGLASSGIPAAEPESDDHGPAHRETFSGRSHLLDEPLLHARCPLPAHPAVDSGTSPPAAAHAPSGPHQSARGQR